MKQPAKRAKPAKSPSKQPAKRTKPVPRPVLPRLSVLDFSHHDRYKSRDSQIIMQDENRLIITNSKSAQWVCCSWSFSEGCAPK